MGKIYKQVPFHSHTDALWAAVFDDLQLPWEYHRDAIVGRDAFFLSDLHCWIVNMPDPLTISFLNAVEKLQDKGSSAIAVFPTLKGTQIGGMGRLFCYDLSESSAGSSQWDCCLCNDEHGVFAFGILAYNFSKTFFADSLFHHELPVYLQPPGPKAFFPCVRIEQAIDKAKAVMRTMPNVTPAYIEAYRKSQDILRNRQQQGATMPQLLPVIEPPPPLPEALESTPVEITVDGVLYRFTPVSRTVYVTPALAAAWLARGSDINRPIMQSTVLRYARFMTEGVWHFNGETLIFDPDGFLLDGQHRLSAIVLSELTLPFAVMEGIPAVVFSTLNTGEHRTLGQMLARREVNPNTLGAAARLLWLYERTGGLNTHKMKPSNQEAMEVLDRNPKLRRSTQFANRGISAIWPSYVACLHYLFAQKDEEAADYFFTAFRSGANLDPSDPIHMLRQRLIESRITNHKLDRTVAAALTIKAWNMHRAGAKGTRLVYRTTGPGAESFPEIK